MTKMKSKKMTKSTFAIIIMAVIMVAMLAFGGTYAYFTATTADKSGVVAKTATVSLTNGTVLTDVMTENILPGEVVLTDTLDLESTSTVKTYVFVTLTSQVKIGEGYVDLYSKTGANDPKSIINIAVENENEDGEWQKVTLPESGAVVYYFAINEDAEGDLLDLGAFTFTVTFSDEVEANMADGTTETNNLYRKATTTDSQEEQEAGYVSVSDTVDIMGANVAVTIKCSAIQQKNFSVATPADVETAYNASTANVATR